MLRNSLFPSLQNDFVFIFSELSKTSLSNNLRKSRSATKKLGTEGKGDVVVHMCELKHSVPIGQ